MDIEAERLAAARLAQAQSSALRELAVRQDEAPPLLQAPTFSSPPAMSCHATVAPPASEPGWWSLAEIAAAYRGGLATPVSLLEELLERIARLDPKLNGFVYLDAEGARSAARDLPRGPLFGVPVGIKDVIDVAGMPTTCHSRLRLGHVAEKDAPVVAALRAAGAIILGKLATHEFAIGGPAFDLPLPPARNPWNPEHHPGGSSSGAGAAVAAGLIPLAIGTDTAGSVRNPASACGIVGLKPTRGLLSTEGVVPLAWSLDHVGILGRSADDVRIALQALAPVAAPASEPRVGYVRHFHTRDLPAAAEVAAALDRAAAALGAEEVTLPPLGEFALVNRIILQAEGHAYHADDLHNRPDWFSRRTRDALLPGQFVTSADYIKARRLQATLAAAVEAQLGEFEILLTASSMTTACRLDDDASIGSTYLAQARTPFNVTGHPALAMVAGLSGDGLPLSLQLAARNGEEGTLLAVAERWERAMGGPIRPPL
jgi:aspartyl-tRNA(Asn)/glutamyl-tRNA(Gln) amidotransferase subunit A